MKSIQSSLAVVMPLATLLAVTGCTTPPNSSVQYRPPPTVNPRYTHEANGHKLTIDPIFDEARAEAVFDLNPRKIGIFPIHVRLENKRANAGFLVQKKNFEVQATGDLYQTETQGDIGTRAAKASPPSHKEAGLVIRGYFPGSFNYNASVNRNFVREELRDDTLASGQSLAGCVYFQMPEKRAFTSGVLRVSIPDLESNQTIEIEMPFGNTTSNQQSQ